MTRALASNAIAAAYRLFKSFHGRIPYKGEVREIQGQKVVALEVGEIVRIDYVAKAEGRERYHLFARSNRPVLFSSFDGSQLYILAGGYGFTSRGIEG